MHIKMDKVKETYDFVEYQFFKLVEKDWYINEQEKKQVSFITRIGLCRFTKVNEQLIFVEKETHPYFLNRSDEWRLIFDQLKECQKLGKFPKEIEI